MANTKSDYLVTGSSSGRKVRQLRKTSGRVLQEPLPETSQEAKGTDEDQVQARALAKVERKTDKIPAALYEQVVYSTTDIMSSIGNCRPTDNPVESITSTVFPVSSKKPALTLSVLGGDLRPVPLADAFLNSVWEYLSRQEAKETDLSLRDDLRIAKLCILEVERGTPSPWLNAFWSYLGISYPKYLGILAEREAYKKILGPTLAEQLSNPVFLATLGADSRPFYSRLQMRLPIPPKSVPSQKKTRRTA